MSTYTKITEIRQSKEVIYYKDGEEIHRDPASDDYAFDSLPEEPMTQDEIELYGDDD